MASNLDGNIPSLILSLTSFVWNLILLWKLMETTITNNHKKNMTKGRTYELSELDIKVIRFTNQEVLENLDFVLKEISSHLKPPHP